MQAGEKKASNEKKWYEKNYHINDTFILLSVLGAIIGFLVAKLSDDLKYNNINKIKTKEFKENLDIQIYISAVALVPVIFLFYHDLKKVPVNKGEKTPIHHGKSVKIEKIICYILLLAYSIAMLYYGSFDFDNEINGFNWTSALAQSIGVQVILGCIFGIYEAYVNKDNGIKLKHITKIKKLFTGSAKNIHHTEKWLKVTAVISVLFIIFFAIFAIWLAPSQKIWPFNDYKRESGPIGTTNGFMDDLN